jgi:hypothetical protein
MVAKRARSSFGQGKTGLFEHITLAFSKLEIGLRKWTTGAFFSILASALAAESYRRAFDEIYA